MKSYHMSYHIIFILPSITDTIQNSTAGTERQRKLHLRRSQENNTNTKLITKSETHTHIK